MSLVDKDKETARKKGIMAAAATGGAAALMFAVNPVLGVIALVPELELVPLEKLTVEPTSLFLALDEIQDPQNFGASIRSAVVTTGRKLTRLNWSRARP